VPVVLAHQLAEGRRIEVEPFDPDLELVGPELGPGVQPPGGLGQHHGVVEDPVQTGRVAGRRTVADRSHRLSSIILAV
jgi:hypothetical protein